MAKNNYSFSQVVETISNNFGVILIAVLFLVGGFFVGSIWTENQVMKAGGSPSKQVADAQAADPTEQKADSLDKMPEISKDDHIRGAKNPKIYLVEYSDYECPYCSRFHPTMEQIMEEYGDQVAWVYRHYPLAFHANAQPAAETAECVADLGGDDAFWSFTDAIFKENERLGGKINDEAINTAIAASGVNASKVNDCVKNGDKTELVNAQMSGGSAAGISGTPGTIIVTDDGQYELISGALPFAQVKQTVEKYL